jgi:hypothetical protein
MGKRMEPTEPGCVGTMTQNRSGHAIQSLPASEQLSTNSCARCAGLLVSERYYDLHNTGEHHIESLRCVQCGYRIDPVILQNHIRPPVESQAKRPARSRYSHDNRHRRKRYGMS